MFHNYFFLKRLAVELDVKLKGFKLIECFSQNKDELILGFCHGKQEFFIRANLDPNVSLLSFPDQFARAGRNSVDLFPQLRNKIVSGVTVFSFERSFQIEFEEERLIFKMHARRGNILYAEGNQTLQLFRKSLQPDIEIIPSDLNKQIAVSAAAFTNCGNDPLVLIPALGKEVRNYLEHSDFYKLDEGNKWDAFENLLARLNESTIYLHESPFISLLISNEVSTDSAIEAANWLYQKTVRSFYFEKEKNEGITKLKQKIKKTENYITKTSSKLQQVLSDRSPEEIANILMANLNSLQTGLSKAILYDFYLDQPIEIKLNVTLSPQKNAENLYRKAKNRHQEIAILNDNISVKESLIDQLSRQILHIDSIEDTKELRTYFKTHGLTQKSKTQEVNLPYHHQEVEGWDILIGKNAKANDELTLKVANKNDLWLHAKDVPGSHVILRQRAGQKYPTYIIEKAAALAAAHSKRKTDTLCPVIYTEKKYVRKLKGSPAGQVIVEKEEVLMIEPSKEV